MGRDGGVLVTGGCGSVGSAVVAQLLDHNRMRPVVVYDNDEHSLVRFEKCLSDSYPAVRFEMGDVRDSERLAATMHDVDYVIHTAGVKQVPQCESHPYEAMRTNADGTWNVIQAAKRADVESVVTLSTDKAVGPASTMGASKMLAERVMQASADRIGSNGPRLGCVRLGNVIGSAGSVVPLFKDQIENEGPVTVTEPDMTRFAMSKGQAAEFVIDCVEDQPDGRIRAPKIDRLQLIDLAEAMIAEYAPPGTAPEDIDIETIGRRPGERLHEYLIGPTEIDRTVEHDDYYSIGPPSAIANQSEGPAETSLPVDGYRSDSGPFMSHDQIIELIEDDAATEAESTFGIESAPVSGIDD